MNYISAVLTDRDREIEKERTLLEERMGSKERGTFAQKDVLPSVFAESVYLLDGRPFRLKDRDYLKAIYNWPIEDGLLMCGRQVEKSTTFSAKLSNDTLLRPFYRGLYYAPLNEQVKVFSEDRLGRLFKYSQSDVIKKYYMERDDKQNVFNKSFGAVGSLIYLRHAYGNGDNIRGISVNGIYGDEIQDVYIDALPVIGETQAHARDLGPGVLINWKAGTPKTFSNTIQQLWNRSNQMEWIVRCFHCGTDQLLGEKNITPTKYVCRKCGKEITTENISKNGQWVKFNKASDMYGFRINQIMNPSMPASDVFNKMENYPKGKFYNEVLGRSYEHAQKPMPRYLLRRLFADYAMLGKREPPYQSSPITVGVDWGHGTSSFTVVVVATEYMGKFRVLYTRKFKEGEELQIDYQKKEIAKIYQHFGVNYGLGDYGDGFEQGQAFNRMFGNRFDMCYYSWNQAKLVDYAQKNLFWTVNRDRCLYWYVEDIKNGKIEWPGKNESEVQHLLDDHEVIQIEYRSSETRSPEGNVATRSSNSMMFTHPVGIPDDSFHASFYSWLAMKLLLNKPVDPTEAGSHTVHLAGAMTEGMGSVI